MGAMTEAENRPAEFRTLVATADSARKIGLRRRMRVSSTRAVRSAASNPGAMSGAMAGAAMNVAMASAARTTMRRFAIVETTLQARSRSPVATRAAIVGMTADARAPAATSWKRKSGIRKAAM